MNRDVRQTFLNTPFFKMIFFQNISFIVCLGICATAKDNFEFSSSTMWVPTISLSGLVLSHWPIS